MGVQVDRQGVFDYPFMKLDTEEETWTAAGVIPFFGSDKMGVPKMICVVCGKKGGATQFSVRVFDKTNAMLIAKKTNQSVNYPELLDLGAISNVSEGPAIWEVQVKKTAGVEGKVVTVASVVMEF